MRSSGTKKKYFGEPPLKHPLLASPDSGSDWQYRVYDLTGTWTKGENEYVVRADGRAYRFSPAIYEFGHFYAVGKTVYPRDSEWHGGGIPVGSLQSDSN